jgi:Ran GTPase-activating protein (RanGAP) involved in mRNA processing and transport
MELADALLENTNVTYLLLGTALYTKSSAEAMAKYVRTSKHLRRIRWHGNWSRDDRALNQHEETLCCFIAAIQESSSLKELRMELPLICGPSNLALENMLTHTQSLRSLHLSYPFGPLEDMAVAAVRSGLKKNATLRELTLQVSRRTSISPIRTSLRDHPLLQRLCLRGYGMDLTGLETLLLSGTSKITELDIHGSYEPMIGLTHLLHALARRPTLTKLGLRRYSLGRDEARWLRMALCSIPSLHSLVLRDCTLGSAELAELAPALYHNTSIKVLDLSENELDGMESATLLRDILRSNKTMTALDLSGNRLGETTGTVEYIADGLGSNSTLLKIDLSSCALRDGGVSILAQSLGSRNTTLQKLTLHWNAITSTGVGVLLETMEQSSHITDLVLDYNPIKNDGASILARSLGNNALPNFTRLSLSGCDISDDGFIALVSALAQNTSLLHLDLCDDPLDFSERALLALAESLPEIKMLQRLDLTWFLGIASVMPLLLAGLRKNTSLFRFHVAGCAPHSVPPTPEETSRCAGGWMQEMERLGYRNRFLPLIRAPKERLPPLGVWPRALARVATLPDVIFEVLRSKPSLVPSEDTEGKEAAEDTGVPKKRKRGDE